MRIGIAGMGKMGRAMAARLVETGAEVTAWSRSPEKSALAGVRAVRSPVELAACNDVVLSVLSDGAALRSVYNGEHGLLGAAAGTLFVEMSTVLPREQQELAAAVRNEGGMFVECPVGGTTGPARAGQLLGLAGGDAVDIERALPILQRLCRRIEHIGPIGAGAAMKLAINLPLIVFWQSFGEALALVQHLGKDPDWLVHLFSDTAGAPNVLKIKQYSVVSALRGAPHVESTFDIDSMRKDLRTMLAEAATLRADLPVTARALSALDEASAAGLGASDGSCMPAFWSTKAQVASTG